MSYLYIDKQGGGEYRTILVTPPPNIGSDYRESADLAEMTCA